MHQRLARIATEIHADGIVDRRDAASTMHRHDQRLLEPKTEEKRIAPCEAGCGAGVGETGGGVGCGGSGAAGAGASESAVVAGTAARGPPPSLREDIRLNCSRSGHFAFSAATCTHSINAVFLASRRCAFM